MWLAPSLSMMSGFSAGITEWEMANMLFKSYEIVTYVREYPLLAFSSQYIHCDCLRVDTLTAKALEVT